MKKIESLVLAAVLALFVAPAFAWVDGDAQCVAWLRQNGTNHPECPTTTLPSAQPSVTATGGAAQSASIANALARGDARAAAELWATVSPELRSTVMTAVNNDPRITTEIRANFQDAINNRNTNNNNLDIRQGGATAGANGNGAGNTTVIGGATYSYPTVPVEGARVSLQMGPQAPNSGVTLWASGCMPVFTVEEIRKMMAISHSFIGFLTMRTENGVVMGTKLTGNEGFLWTPWETIGYKSKKIAVTQRSARGVQALFQIYLAGSSTASGLNVNKMTEAGAASTGSGIQTLGKEIDLLPCEVTQTREWELLDEPKKSDPEPEKPKAAAPAKHLLTIEEDVTVPGRKTTIVPAIGMEWCKKNPGQCTEVKGTPGTRKRVKRTIDCTKPESAEDAKRCAEGEAEVGKPARVESEVIGQK